MAVGAAGLMRSGWEVGRQALTESDSYTTQVEQSVIEWKAQLVELIIPWWGALVMGSQTLISLMARFGELVRSWWEMTR